MLLPHREGCYKESRKEGIKYWYRLVSCVLFLILSPVSSLLIILDYKVVGRLDTLCPLTVDYKSVFIYTHMGSRYVATYVQLPS